MKLRIALLVLASVGLAACGGANAVDQRTSAKILRQYEISQPAPLFKWSQIRQTLIDIETAQAHVTQTTSFFFNLGVSKPIQSCPSIGFPVATTTEITNPQQAVGDSGGTAIAQIDPNGVYTGNSTGTYVLCVAPNGSTYAQYWEGYVDTVSGPAVWDAAVGSVRLTGPSSASFKVGR